MGLKDRVKRALKATETSTFTLTLPDGSVVHYTTEDWFDALSAAIDEEPHWLIDAACRARTNEGPIGLLWVLFFSQEQRRASGAEEGED